jgi:hypothetical protein
MKLVLIESPFAGDIERNVAYARVAVRDSVLRGEAPICSHLLFTQPGILKDDISSERTAGIAAGLEWRRACDYVAFYLDLGMSKGMAWALEIYHAEGIKVVERRILE